MTLADLGEILGRTFLLTGETLAAVDPLVGRRPGEGVRKRVGV